MTRWLSALLLYNGGVVDEWRQIARECSRSLFLLDSVHDVGVDVDLACSTVSVFVSSEAVTGSVKS